MVAGDERLISIIPTERQIRFQELEFYAFIHFTVNTFTDKEWGDGTEEPAIFNPEKLDAKQWVRNVKAVLPLQGLPWTAPAVPECLPLPPGSAIYPRSEN